jgi:hypothetical protein
MPPAGACCCSSGNFLDGAQPVAPSAIAAEGHVRLMRPPAPYPVPRPLALEEIPGVIEAYRKGAENAQAAGFDAVEIHGANGYLLDQFLQDGSNKRTDAYGGSIENRARLMLEVTDAVISVWGPGRVGMHLAPRGDAQSMGDSDPLAAFSHVARELGKRKIAFICARERLGEGRIGPELKKAFGGTYIANEDFTRQTAEQVIAAGEARVRQAVHRQSRPARPLPQQCAPQHAGPGNERATPRPPGVATGAAVCSIAHARHQ